MNQNREVGEKSVDREGPDGGTDPEPVSERRNPTLKDVEREFQALKVGDGISPAKLTDAHAIQSITGIMAPLPLMQRVVDDIVELGGDDADALLWALRAHPRSHEWQSLDMRREQSGVAENTAKDREKRAVQKLFDKWSRPKEFWASAVYGTIAKFLPVTGKVQIGSYEVEVEVFDDDERGLPVVVIKSPRPDADLETLTVVRQSNHTHLVFFTSKYPWRLHLNVRRITEEFLLIYRPVGEDGPYELVVEQTDADGISGRQSIPREALLRQPILQIPSETLDAGVTLTWWWVDPERPRAMVLYPLDQDRK